MSGAEDRTAAIARKRAGELEVVGEMVRLYCRKQHGTRAGRLCGECGELLAYATERISRCPFMETKTFCSSCEVHCYVPDKREAIRRVMRFSGPRMLLHHPLLVMRHWRTE